MYQYEELGWFGSGWGLLGNYCECSIEPSGFISHWVSSDVELFIKNYKSNSRWGFELFIIIVWLFYLLKWLLLGILQMFKNNFTMKYYCKKFKMNYLRKK